MRVSGSRQLRVAVVVVLIYDDDADADDDDHDDDECECMRTVGYPPASVRPELGQPVHLQLHVSQLSLHGSFSVAPTARSVPAGRQRTAFQRLELHRTGRRRTLCEKHVPSDHPGCAHCHAGGLNPASTDRQPLGDGMTSTSGFISSRKPPIKHISQLR